MTTVFAALLTGLVASLHCAAMCGPLAIAGCRRARDGALYLAGRAVSYATVGAVMGHVGRAALGRLPLRAVELTALLAVALAAAARGVWALRPPREQLVQLGAPSPPWRLIASLVPRRGLALGLATGVLPCGMLVPAWLLAASTESAPLGALTMLAFSAASAIGLVLPLAGGALIGRVARRLPPRAHAVAWLLLACFIAARPLLVVTHCAH